MLDRGWTEIATTVKENYHLFDGFVVLHGTDSLAYTASALSFMMSDLGKPVILTGSQASIFALQSDAVDNLLGSLIIAGTFVVPEGKRTLFAFPFLLSGGPCVRMLSPVLTRIDVGQTKRDSGTDHGQSACSLAIRSSEETARLNFQPRRLMRLPAQTVIP